MIHFLPILLYLWNGWAHPFELFKAHFVAIIEENKKRITKNEQELVPAVII
jgi:hypothetical protein